ncbi:YbcC family protein [Rhodopseudomonas sp.]|uniref:YbcC family protein n=1 Tax=Rhodopseudomonas sp. TaxID=1078 RepID=UPI0039E5FE04
MLMIAPQISSTDDELVLAAADRAARAIPPLWPLTSSVAVNPFLGQTSEPLAVAAARWRRAAGASLTMPRAWYLERIDRGEIADDDLTAALEAAPPAMRPATLADLKRAARAPAAPVAALPTVAELASAASGLDWTGFVAERIGHWAAGYFDEGQALWAAPNATSAYQAWRLVATHDLTPEIFGLAGFASHVAAAPSSPAETLVSAANSLGLGGDALESYFHRLLTGLSGWSQCARYRLWQAELGGGSDATLTDLLAIRLIWEEALLRNYAAAIEPAWRQAAAAFADPVQPTADEYIDAILQEAAERASQRRLQAELLRQPVVSVAERPAMQAAFCIDVRSEVFRRALESLDSGIETMGFGGFFGLRIAHRAFASDVVENRFPVLMTPGAFTCTGTDAGALARNDAAARLAARAKRAWGRFKLAAISSFAFVEATGPVYVGKLMWDGLGFDEPAAPDEAAPRFDPAPDLAFRIDTAETVLRAMSLTGPFARLVLIAGHGAGVLNNPHASALACGACGGHSGDVNARLLAALLNDREVRAGLAGRDIRIPVDTWFVAALHDTVTDRVTLYDADAPSPAHRVDLDRARGWLAAAGTLARSERSLRLPRASSGDDVARRARDWAEVRPEWALAGCQAFLAAPRGLTRGCNFEGRVFLHDYDYAKDEKLGVLELILTAPVVVASWISLQYYGSTVAPAVLGAGNKLLHNVTGGIGVVEGNGGLLRAGLPWQSVHDGTRCTHDPLRLSVLIAAPREAIATVLARHPEVRALFDNKWLHLFALDERGRMAWRYAGGLDWQAIESADTAAEPAAAPQ